MANILSVGQSALAAAQIGLSMTGHNIANASTPGYSRQVVLQSAIHGQDTGFGFVGKGTEVAGVQRVYSEILGRQWYPPRPPRASSIATMPRSARSITCWPTRPPACRPPCRIFSRACRIRRPIRTWRPRASPCYPRPRPWRRASRAWMPSSMRSARRQRPDRHQHRRHQCLCQTDFAIERCDRKGIAQRRWLSAQRLARPARPSRRRTFQGSEGVGGQTGRQL